MQTNDQICNIDCKLIEFIDFKRKSKDTFTTINSFHSSLASSQILNNLYLTFVQLNTEMSLIAEKQFCALLGIPYEYIKKCDLFLIQLNINYWIEQFKDKPILVRKYLEQIRGILSSRYNTLYDDHITFPIIQNEINNELVNQVQLTRSTIEKDSQFMLLGYDNIANAINYKNYTFIPRIEISNSEIGLASFRIKPCIQIKNNDSGNAGINLTSLSVNGLTKISHLKQLNGQDEFRSIIHQGIINAHEAAFLGIKEAIKLLEEPVINPHEELNKISKSCTFLTKRIRTAILSEYEDKEITKLKLIEDILTLMRNAPLAKYIIFQEQIGNYFHLFKEIKETKSQIINVSKKEEIDFRFNFDL